MAYKLITSPETEKDIENAVSWYKDIRKSLAQKFIIDLRAAIKYIHQNPKKLQIRYGEIRIAFMKKFPYGIHYKIENKTIVVLGIFQTAENPDKWEER